MLSQQTQLRELNTLRGTDSPHATCVLTGLLVAHVCVCVCVFPVQEAHPDVQAVASGAIASDYQRLRVESVSVALSSYTLV
jgi:hypothetical protein